MREFIMATEFLLQVEPSHDVEGTTIIETPVAQADCLLQELKDIVFKLRAFTESADGEMSLGIKLGMQRAADMVENIINHHTRSGE